MFRISREFHFPASHQLCTLPDSHPRASLHGHNHITDIELTPGAGDAEIHLDGIMVCYERLIA